MTAARAEAALTLGMTTSACGTCRRLVPAKIVVREGVVCFQKACPLHGESLTPVRGSAREWLDTLRYVKPAWVPGTFGGDARRGCPDGCGFCDRHEQHLCMPIVEVTDRCDLGCPVCLNASGVRPGDEPRDLPLAAFRSMLDRLLQAEPQVDVLNLSGGEPLLHPAILDLVDEAVSRREIVRVSVSTNGLPLLRQPGLLDALRARNVVISLQFDGFSDRAYEVLRGRPLLREKEEILRRLAAADATATLTMTVARGVNDDQFAPVLERLFTAANLVSLMIQPVAFTGRAAGLAGAIGGISIPEIVRRLDEAGHPSVRAADFVPLPCSHPLCFSLAFYLMLDGGGSVPLNRLVNAGTMMDSLANRVFFGLDAEEHERMKALVYERWSGPAGAVPDSDRILGTLRRVLRETSGRAACDCFDPRAAFAAGERRVKSVFIHAFQDAGTFDLDRVRRCCQAYPQPDGRLLPACVRNVLHPPGGGAA